MTAAPTQEDLPFRVDMPAYLARHDIVYQSPGCDGYEGFPMGNGDLGGMVWCAPTGLRLQINKSDLWDEKDDETPCRALRLAAHLDIDLGAPCMEWKYLSDFEGRLSLHDAQVTIRTDTPFLRADIATHVDANRNVWVLHCRVEGRGELIEGAAARLGLERWGSRTFPGWYGGFSRDPRHGLGCAEVECRDGDLVLTESLADMGFAVACRVVGSDPALHVVSKHRGEATLPRQPAQEFTIFVAVVNSEEAADPAAAARSLLDKASEQGYESGREAHLDWWRAFWARSFVHLGDDYIENLYYLKRYLMAASSRGRYPVLFNGGLWLWNGDVRNWVAPHHWNMEESYWGLCAQGDADLLLPYAEAYWRQLEAGQAFARERGAEDAILWSEAHDYHGNMPYKSRGDMLNNHTPASQVAAFFWEYYLYTGDRSFLEQRAYPFMKQAAEFYLQKLEWDTGGEVYGIFPSQSYECPETNQLRNPITDRVMIESLFRNCLAAAGLLDADEPRCDQWRHVLEHLWEPGIAEHPAVGRVLVEACTPDGQIWWRHGDGELNYHFSPQSAIVFPAGLVGTDDEGSPLFEAVCNYLAGHPPHKNAISPDPIVAARLGLGSRAVELLANSIRRLQHFPQGLFYNIDHWYQYSRYARDVADAELVTQRDYVYDRRCRHENTGAPTLPFVQCGMEPLGILGAAVNEMLLQSYDGVLRLFPAVPDDWEGAFTLYAVGGFTVSARRDRSGVIGAVAIESARGGTCLLANPWPGKEVGATRLPSSTAETLAIDTSGRLRLEAEPGCRYVLQALGAGQTEAILYTGDPNPGPKSYHEAVLGRPRDF